MATIRERGEYQFQAIVETKNRATGLVHKEAKTFTTRSQAQEWSHALESDLRRAQHNDTRVIDSTPLRDLIQRYVDEVSPKKLGSKQEIVRLKAWLKHPIAERSLSRCLPKDFADHVAARRKAKSIRGGHVAEQTIKHELIAISNVFETARKDWGYNITNPIKSISKPGGSQTREARITPENWLALADELRKCRNPLYIVIAELAIETGMREDELFRMTWGDLDMQRRVVNVLGKDTTTRTGQRKRRAVPLSARAMGLLSALPRALKNDALVFQTARKTSADGLSRAFTAACKTVGIIGGCFHTTRHEAASRMAPHYPMLTLMSIMGWKTPSMAARYYHASVDDLHAGLDRMRAANDK